MINIENKSVYKKSVNDKNYCFYLSILVIENNQMILFILFINKKAKV